MSDTKQSDEIFESTKRCFLWTVEKVFLNDDLRNIIAAISNSVKNQGVNEAQILEFEDFWKKTNNISSRRILQINDIINFVKKQNTNDCKMCNGCGWVAISTGNNTASAVRCNCMPIDQYVRYDAEKHNYLFAMRD